MTDTQSGVIVQASMRIGMKELSELSPAQSAAILKGVAQVVDAASSAPGRTLAGVEIDPNARIEQCRSCGKPIWWGRTAAGKACPFDVIGRERTAVTHFSTCKDATEWSKR